MDPFLNLPDEMIINLCNEMKTPDLLNTAQASSKVYQVCFDIIKERYIKNLILSQFSSVFIKNINNVKLTTNIYNYNNGYISIEQFIDNFDSIQNFPSILPTSYYTQIFPEIIHGQGPVFRQNQRKTNPKILKTDAIITRIAKDLIEQDYSFQDKMHFPE